MRVALFFLPLALAAPTHPRLDLAAANAQDGIDHLSEYFNILADKTKRYKALDEAPVCDITQAVLPTIPEDPLPTPEDGVVVKHVALGRGTQNYTCTDNATAAPVLAGAVATLFDVTCLSSVHPNLLSALSRLSISYHPSPPPFTAASPSNAGFGDGPLPELGPGGALAVSGVHYFDADGVPFFDLDRAGIGHVGVAVNESSPAPAGASVGLQSEKAVGWLRLVAAEGAEVSGGLEEVYRVHTVGGSAPASCEGMPEKFQVEYAAQYWFLGKDE